MFTSGNNREIKTLSRNERLAELVGIILGDGHIHKKNNLITIVGSLEDLEYYKNRAIPLFEDLFNVKVSLKRRKDRNAYYLMAYSKYLVNELVSVGLMRGAKDKVTIPKFIFSNKRYLLAFLRGIFDTDGCIKFSKQSKNINYYPRIQIALKDSPLAHNLKDVFECLNFSFCMWKENQFNGIIFYQISGKKNTFRWFLEVSPKNDVHVSKFLFWKKFGYYVPKSTLEYRRNMLADKT